MENLLQCLSLLVDDNDFRLIESGLIVIAQLCIKEENCFKFLYHDAMATIVKILDKEFDVQVYEAVALAVHKVYLFVLIYSYIWQKILTSKGSFT